MYLSTGSFDLTNSTIGILHPLNEGSSFNWINVTDLQVINMPGNSHLRTFNNLVGNTRIVWIEFKSI